MTHNNTHSGIRTRIKQTAALLPALVLAVTLCACGGAKQEKAAPYDFLEETLGEESYAIGFRVGDEVLAETVSGAVKALVLNRTYARIGERYPEISDYLCLKPEDVVEASLPAQNSGESSYIFRQGFDRDYPPYSYLLDDGSAGGFDVELCRAACEYLGWGYEAVPFQWEDREEMLSSGQCDCIWSGFTKEGRENAYTWGITYSYNTQGILVSGDSGITSFSDLRGKTVAVQTSSSAAELLAGARAELAESFGELKSYDTYTRAYEDLKSGGIDAVAIDMTAGTYLIAGETEGTR